MYLPKIIQFSIPFQKNNENRYREYYNLETKCHMYF